MHTLVRALSNAARSGRLARWNPRARDRRRGFSFSLPLEPCPMDYRESFRPPVGLNESSMSLSRRGGIRARARERIKVRTALSRALR